MAGRDEKMWGLVSGVDRIPTKIVLLGWHLRDGDVQSRPSGQMPTKGTGAEAGRLSRQLSSERVYKKREVGGEG